MKIESKRNALALAAIITASVLLLAAAMADHFTELAVFSASLVMGSDSPYKHPSAVSVSQTAGSALPAPDTSSAKAPVSSAEEPEYGVSSTESASESEVPANLAVTEVDLSDGGSLISGAIRIKSKSSSEIDIEKLLEQAVELSVSDSAQPQVLIYHTHTSEAYMDAYTGTYDADFDVRTRDASHSVIRVGDVIAQKLNAAGIVTIHDTTYHDDPAYRGAYGRSLTTVEGYMQQYPTISVTLDVHRDCLQQADGARLKPTAVINGRKAAQIMLVSGCDDNGTLDFPDWRKNMCFAVHLQDRLAVSFAGLARPIYCWNVRYNLHVTPTSLLVEFGTEANTDEEVTYSAELFADALIELMNEYKTGEDR